MCIRERVVDGGQEQGVRAAIEVRAGGNSRERVH